MFYMSSYTRRLPEDSPRDARAKQRDHFRVEQGFEGHLRAGVCHAQNGQNMKRYCATSCASKMLYIMARARVFSHAPFHNLALSSGIRVLLRGNRVRRRGRQGEGDMDLSRSVFTPGFVATIGPPLPGRPISIFPPRRCVGSKTAYRRAARPCNPIAAKARAARSSYPSGLILPRERDAPARFP